MVAFLLFTRTLNIKDLTLLQLPNLNDQKFEKAFMAFIMQVRSTYIDLFHFYLVLPICHNHHANTKI
jgi:hypothetical protein